jgi:methionyl-tRNA formyltransferase
MNLLIFTNRDLASNYNLNVLLPHIHPYVKYIFVSDKVGGANASPPYPLQELKFYEQTLINDILFPQLEQNTSRMGSDKYLTFNELSLKYAIPIQSLNEVKSAETLDFIRQLQPDLILSVRYGKIFGNEFVRIPKQGIINLHSGLLPQYRGVLASFRAMLNNDATLSCTLHYIDDKTIDTGGIIGYSTIKTDYTQSLLSNILRLYPAATDLIVATIKTIIEGGKPAILPQTEAQAAYFTFPTEAEIDFYIENKGRLMNVHEYAAFIKKYL